MSTLFNEAEADAAVAKILSERKIYMEPVRLYKDQDGQVIQAVSFDIITRDDIQAYIGAAQSELDKWHKALSDYDSLSGAAPVAPPATPPTEPALPVESPPQPPAPTEPAVAPPQDNTIVLQ